MSYRLSRLAPRSVSVRAAVLITASLLAVGGGLTSAGAAQTATLPTITLTITPTSITVGGTPQSGGVNVVTTATGVKEGGAILFQLKPGVSTAEVFTYLETKKKKDLNATSQFGSLVFDAEFESGHPSEAQTNLQPGQYVALATTGEGPPKLRAAFTVTAAKSPATLPAPQAILRATDFGFTGPTTLHNGELVGVENEGYVAHMDLALQVKNLKAAKQLVKLLVAGKQKQALKLVKGGVALSGPVSHGAYQQETINAKPGVYVQVCFVNVQDGRDHTRLGMVRIIKIVK